VYSNEYVFSHDFRTVLQDFFLEKKKRNNKFSLRSFALLLDEDPSFLSKILRGTRVVSAKKIVKYSRVLNLPEDAVSSFLHRSTTSTTADHTPLSQPEIPLASQHLIDYSPSWYHFVIPKLMSLKSFNNNLAWMSKKLNLPKTQVTKMLEQLEKGRFITRVDNNYKVLGNYIYTMNLKDKDSAKVVFKKIMVQSLKMALKSFEDMDANWDTMSHSSSFVSAYAVNIPKAKQKIVEFRQELTALLEQPPSETEKPDMVLNLYYGFNEIKSFENYNSVDE
jgi:uncharacterized protein (TIGR02147 family)